MSPAREGILPRDQRDFIFPSTTDDQRRVSGKMVEEVELVEVVIDADMEADNRSNARMEGETRFHEVFL